jgi:hypothetical protein
MKDLDFDELDRAVNSLIGGTSASMPTEPVEKAIDIPTTLPPVVSPVVLSPEPAVSSGPTVSVPQPLAARRASGRFMDVVHPSSDMRPSLTPVTPVSSPSRSGVTVQPSASAMTASVIAESVASPVVASAVLEEAPVSQWPDPIDFQGPISTPVLTTEVTEPATKEDDDKDINKIADDITASLAGEPIPKPLETPFLSDAKVDKRPLGAFSDETTSILETAQVPIQEPKPIVDLVPPSDQINGADVNEHPIENDTPLPAELQGDLLSIESNENIAAPGVNDQFIPPTSVIPTGPTSINQQYTEQPSTSDQPTGEIFDTPAYKKPLAHPKKKKTGWLVIVWIIGLLIVGAGIGAAVYFFVLPHL